MLQKIAQNFHYKTLKAGWTVFLPWSGMENEKESMAAVGVQSLWKSCHWPLFTSVYQIYNCGIAYFIRVLNGLMFVKLLWSSVQNMDMQNIIDQGKVWEAIWIGESVFSDTRKCLGIQGYQAFLNGVVCIIAERLFCKPLLFHSQSCGSLLPLMITQHPWGYHSNQSQGKVTLRKYFCMFSFSKMMHQLVRMTSELLDDH